MKNYLRLFLIIIPVIFVLNVVQAEPSPELRIIQSLREAQPPEVRRAQQEQVVKMNPMNQRLAEQGDTQSKCRKAVRGFPQKRVQSPSLIIE